MLIPTDTSMGPLGIKYQRVSAEISDGTAVTKVEQVFVNTAPRQLEAHYVFPLPKGAALQDFYLWINGKKTKGEMLEKQKATEIYEGIVRRLQDPGLLEYVDSDVVPRARVPGARERRAEDRADLQPGARLPERHLPLPLPARSRHARRARAHGEAGLHVLREPQVEDADALDLLADPHARRLAQG